MQQGLHIRNLFPSDYLAESEVVHKGIIKNGIWTENQHYLGKTNQAKSKSALCFLNNVRRMISSICLWQRKYGLPQHTTWGDVQCALALPAVQCSVIRIEQWPPMVINTNWLHPHELYYFASCATRILHRFVLPVSEFKFFFFWIEFDFVEKEWLPHLHLFARPWSSTCWMENWCLASIQVIHEVPL